MSINKIVQQITDKFADSPSQQLLAGALKTSINNQRIGLEELLAAKESGDLTSEEFEMELEREKMIIETELLTLEICAKAEVQKLVNKAFELLQEAVI